jgi:hypothetical protein
MKLGRKNAKSNQFQLIPIIVKGGGNQSRRMESLLSSLYNRKISLQE